MRRQPHRRMRVDPCIVLSVSLALRMRRAGLRSAAPPFCLTDSTNTRARELAEAGAPAAPSSPPPNRAPVRPQGRTWTAPAGKALLYSAILRPLDQRHLLLPLAVPARGLRDGRGAAPPASSAAIKWPNDVWLEGRKLAGILIEAKPAGRLGGDRRRPQPRRRSCRFSTRAPRLCDLSLLRPLPRQGVRKGPPEPPRCCSADPSSDSPHRSGGSEPPPRSVGRRPRGPGPHRVAQARRSARPRDQLGEGSGVADGVDDTGRLVVVVPGGERVSLGAGEVHLSL